MFRYLLFFLLLAGCATDTPPADTPFVLTDDGAWCWYQDPRAAYIDGAHRRTYAAWMTAGGQLTVGSYDHDTKGVAMHTLELDWDVDDHNTASLLPLDDGRLMAFYARHNGKGLFTRTTLNPEDITSWSDPVTVSDTDRITYSHPVYLRDEGRFYVFWRGPSWKPTFSTSEDGVAWSEPRILLQETGRESDDIRPYLKVFSDGKSAIHLAFTDGHPRNEPTNSIYYARYEAGAFHRADGSRIAGMDETPFRHLESDLVYDVRSSGIRSWIWDIAADADGTPVIAYTRLPEETDHRYHYARWNGSGWDDQQIVAAGPWFPQTPAGEAEREVHYSGGIVIHPSHPDIVYLSRPVDGVFEIERWDTPDAGATWTSHPITQHSEALNVRPVVPYGYPGTDDLVLWMNGAYVHYTDYHTGIWIANRTSKIAQ
ncbi:MAG: BNR-4 repeat-containing protein [Rhodothermales bacterium]